MRLFKAIACVAAMLGLVAAARGAQRWDIEVRGLRFVYSDFSVYPPVYQVLDESADQTGFFVATDANLDDAITTDELLRFELTGGYLFEWTRGSSYPMDFHYSPSTGLQVRSERYRQLVIFGDSLSTYSPIGYEYRYSWTPTTTTVVTLVPEPAIWAMLLAATPLLYVASRRTRR